MAGSFKVGMTLTAKDDASAVLVKGLKLTTKAATDAEKAVERAGNEQQKSNEKNARSARTAAEESRRAAAARETLGVRSERAIRREIDQTIASYNRLTRAGVASAPGTGSRLQGDERPRQRAENRNARLQPDE
ncbi:hypothetical protein [Enterobacter asburiae]|uniref:hypothetical protein n=1 Tax=Enterobacter asburiae TaxID=61645 RepID=UPI003EE527C2